MTTRLLFNLALGLALISPLARAEDWPQWRGPHRDGISQEKGLLKEWPTGGPTLLWHNKEIDSGYSTPALVGDRLLLQSNKGNDDEFVFALGVADGKSLWSSRLGNVGPNNGPQYPGARGTPTVDGKLTFALGSDGDLGCVETETGRILWSKNLRRDFGGKPGAWAYSESPLVDGDTVVCTPGGTEATMIALHKKTGDVIWKSEVPGGDEASYSSIIVVHAAGAKQYVQFLQKGLVGVEANTGKFLWRYEKTAKGSPANIPTPVADGDLVYSAASRSGGGLVKVVAEQGMIVANEVYFSPKMPSSIGGSVKLGDYLYGTNTQGLMCVAFATGEVKWIEKSTWRKFVCFADGRLYMHGENGDVALVDPSPEGYREVSRFKPADAPDVSRFKAWAYPVVANGRLYLREMNSIWCYDVRAK